MTKDIISLAPQRSIKIESNSINRIPRRRRRGASSCDAFSRRFNQDVRRPNDDGREREGNRELTHVGVIPTCPPTKYQLIEPRTIDTQINHKSAEQSGNILISKHGGQWHAGAHPDYG